MAGSRWNISDGESHMQTLLSGKNTEAQLRTREAVTTTEAVAAREVLAER